MYNFKQTFPTPKERTAGKNTCEYIILHHTGTKENTIKGVLDGLYKRDDFASCHFVVDTNGDAYKIGEPTDILWHAGKSEWKGKKDLNNYSVGIEIIGPLSNGGFTDAQRKTVRNLVQHLMAVLKIPKEKVIRHKDISPGRKPDVADTFWNTGYSSYWLYQKTFTPIEFFTDLELSVKAGIYDGKNPDKVPTRSEAAKMIIRAAKIEDTTKVWNGINPDAPISSFELNTMTLRAFSLGCGATTLSKLAEFCYRASIKK